MKSKTLFCNRAILKNDITRFLPVWGIYTVGLTMMFLLVLGNCKNEVEIARQMKDMCIIMLAVNGIYAMVVSQALFGDLLNSRMCYALHAMPLTRDDLFGTHTFAGFCFSIIPNTVVMLASALTMGKAAPAVLYVLGASICYYIFYFGTALLGIQLAGNRIAAVLIYGLLNFWLLLVSWFVKFLYEPILYGVAVPIRETILRFCFTADMMIREFFVVNFDGTDWKNPILEEIVPTPAWRTLGIWTIVGVAAIVLAHFLYRHRKLEVAGDLVAYKRTRPVFMVLFSLMVAGFCHVASYAVQMGEGITGIFVIAVGMVIGWIAGLMLLERQVQVFRLKLLKPVLVMLVLLVISVGCCAADVFGVVNKVPQAQDVKTLTVYSNGYTWNAAKIHDTATIQELVDLQRRELADYKTRGLLNTLSGNRNTYWGSDDYNAVTMIYELNNGKTLRRDYEIFFSGEDAELLTRCLNRGEAIFGMEFDSVDDLAAKVDRVSAELYFGEYHENDIKKEDIPGLIDAILADAAENNMAASWTLHRFELNTGCIQFEYNVFSIEPDVQNQLEGWTGRRFATVNVFSGSTHTIDYMVQKGYWDRAKIDAEIERYHLESAEEYAGA